MPPTQHSQRATHVVYSLLGRQRRLPGRQGGPGGGAQEVRDQGRQHSPAALTGDTAVHVPRRGRRFMPGHRHMLPVCVLDQTTGANTRRERAARAATLTLPPPPQERVPVRSMHARPCVLHGPATGASTSASVPLSAPAAGRPGARLSRFRTSAHAGRSVTAATHSSPAAHDDAAPAVPRRLVLATPPALALLLSTALQPGSAAAAARRLKAPPVAEFLTLPVSAVPRLAGGYVLRLWSASLTQRRR